MRVMIENHLAIPNGKFLGGVRVNTSQRCRKLARLLQNSVQPQASNGPAAILKGAK